MDRRKSLKILTFGSLGTGVWLEACKTEDQKSIKPKGPVAAKPVKLPPGMMKEEVDELKKVESETFFNSHEMKTITVLGDIIIPKDNISGSASEAGVPAFIEFIVKDKPENKLPMRGGLQWLDQQSLRRYQNVFINCTATQQIELVDAIAYPQKAAPEMKPGVSFFSLMRNLTASGFYTTPMGYKDVGYKGNTPNAWNGVPDDVLKQYGLAYSAKELKECVSYPESK
ncbi:MAG: gluconate 2-dehydrogenase subunit 3 family protein [Chitinophagaceae bacterium]|nr:gluconate 2-dehydrogenase subunit 3 family protein [Chitinophagaceae bacterium]